MKGEDGRHWFVVAGSELHVAAILVLRDLGDPSEPRGEAAAQGGAVARHRGARAPETPQDPVGPRRFPLLAAEQNKMVERYSRYGGGSSGCHDNVFNNRSLRVL